MSKVVILPLPAALALLAQIPSRTIGTADGVDDPLVWGDPNVESDTVPVDERRVAFGHPFDEDQIAWIEANLPVGGLLLDALPDDWRYPQ